MNYKQLNAIHSAFLVFVDGWDGSLEVWLYPSLEVAKDRAAILQENLEERGLDSECSWTATDKLPRRKIYKVHEGQR